MSPHRFNLHRRMPLEVRLEIFGFLPFKAWYRLCFHNRRTKRVLLGNLRYLAQLPRLDEIRCSFYNQYKEAVNITHSHPSLQESPAEDFKEIESTFKAAQDQGIPLSAMESYSLYLNIRPEQEGSEVPEKWVIRLPVHPKTLGELRLIRHWLRAISRTHFHIFDNYKALFNPAFLQLLFPSGPVIKFHADLFRYPYTSAQTQIEFAPSIFARDIQHYSNYEPQESVVQMACSSGTIPTSFNFEESQLLDKLQHIVLACHALPRPLLDRFPGRLRGLLHLPNPQLAIELPDSMVVDELNDEQTTKITFETTPTKADPKRHFRIQLKTTEGENFHPFEIRCIPVIVADES